MARCGIRLVLGGDPSRGLLAAWSATDGGTSLIKFCLDEGLAGKVPLTKDPAILAERQRCITDE